MSTRWERSDVARGADYDAKWQEMAAEGRNIHGEADLVDALLGGADDRVRQRSVLDAGCGTGRVAVELARRGYAMVGVDADEQMLAAARVKDPGVRPGAHPRVHWVRADLAELGDSLTAFFDLVLLAGNVMIFLEPGTEERVVDNLARRLRPGGLLVAGFSLHPDGLSIDRYDELASGACLHPVRRWSTWDRESFTGGDYAVSVHRRD